MEHLEPAELVGHLLLARGDHDADRLGPESPRGERDRTQRRRVDPVRVVDDAQHAAQVGGGAEQRDRRDADRELVRRLAGGQRERPLERLGLHGGQHVAMLEHRPQQRIERGERQIALGLDATGRSRRQPVRLPDEQRRLPHTGRPGDHQRLAPAGRDGLHERPKPLPLRRPPDERLHPHGHATTLTPVLRPRKAQNDPGVRHLETPTNLKVPDPGF